MRTLTLKISTGDKKLSVEQSVTQDADGIHKGLFIMDLDEMFYDLSRQLDLMESRAPESPVRTSEK